MDNHPNEIRALHSQIYKMKKLANNGDADAQVCYGFCFSDGNVRPTDLNEAAKYFKLAADQNLPEGQFNYGYYLSGFRPKEDGSRSPIDMTLACRLFKDAAEQGHPWGSLCCGYCLAEGKGIPPDFCQSVPYFARIADEEGPWTPYARFNYGLCLYFGKGTPRDVVKAAHYFKLAADEGLIEAKCNYGCCLSLGEGVPRDVATAFRLFEEAVAGGSVVAQFNLAWSYLNGFGCKRNSKQAVQLLRIASDKKYAPAMVHLYVCLSTGKGCKRNLKAAAELLNRAACGQNADSFEKVQFIQEFQVPSRFPKPKGFPESEEFNLFSKLERNFDHLSYEEGELCHGLNGVVRLARDENGRLMAVKTFNTGGSRTNKRVLPGFYHALEALLQFNHPCIVLMYGFQLPTPKKGGAIAYAYMPNHSLKDVLEKVKSRETIPFWNPTGIVKIILGIVKGLEFMHKQGAIHRNIKPSNLLIDEHGHSCIGDLSSSRFVEGGIQFTRQPGTPAYQAPEIYEDEEHYTNKIDIWSLGCVLYEMFALKPAISPTLNPVVIMKKVLNKKLPQLDPNWTEELRNIINLCWNYEPEKRPSATDILNELKCMNYDLIDDVDEFEVEAYVDELEHECSNIREQ